MNALKSSLTALFSEHSAGLLVDLTVKATILLLLAIVTNRVLRSRSAALRHRVWCLTFRGLLALPAMALLLPAFTLQVLPEVSSPPSPPPIATTTLPGAPLSALAAEPAVQMPTAADVTADGGPQPPAPLVTEPRAVGPVAETSAMDPAASRPQAQAFSWASFAISLWVLGVLLSLWPLMVGLLRSGMLSRGANRVEDESGSRLLQATSRRLGLSRDVRLLETMTSIVPITWGVWRPVVLLPRSWRDWSGRRRMLVMLHELAHVKRYDVGCQLLARIACAVYWFHPLAWYALRCLRIERELACDDCVLAAGARPTEYARELVDMARSYQFLALPTAVAMAQSTSLEQRVRCLLDTAQSRLPVSRSGGRLLMLAGVTLVAGIAAVQLAARPTRASESTPVGPDGTTDANDVTYRYQGLVVDPDGQPVAGARLWFVYFTNTRLRRVVEPLSATDADGKFQFSFRQSDFEVNSPTLVATAAGFGFGRKASFLFETTGAALKAIPEPARPYATKVAKNHDGRIHLVRDHALRGRIVNTEGQPVVGARLSVDRLWLNPDNSLDNWEAAARREGATFYSVREHASEAINGQQLSTVIPAATTNGEGLFVLRGLGRERIAQLVLSGPQIESTLLLARTRDGDPVRLPTIRSYMMSMGSKQPLDTYHAARFTHVAAPSMPIVGRVTDAETGQPIVGAFLSAGQRNSFSGMGKSYIYTSTDADGQYRLEGLPQQGAEQIFVSVPGSAPYVSGGFRVSLKSDKADLRRDLKLRRGVWVRGTAKDARTGKPLSGAVQYYADELNKSQQDYPLFRGGGFCERRCDRNGGFAIPVLPGRGIITFMPDDHTSFRRGIGAEDITVAARGQAFRTSPVTLFSSNVCMLKEINPAADSEPMEMEIRPSSGTTIRGTVVDPDGNRLSGGVFARDTSMSSASFNPRTGEYQVNGYFDDKPREIFFFHREKKLAAMVTYSGPQEQRQTVSLRKTGTIRGRLLDAAGEPMALKHLNGKGIPSYRFGAESRRVMTDADGRFEIPCLLPGEKYTVHVYGDSMYLGRVLVNEAIDGTRTKDLGDVTIKPPEMGGVLPNPSAQPADKSPARGKAKKPSKKAKAGVVAF